MIIAVDFDGTLCTHAFPEIGEITDFHKQVINFVRKSHKNGDTIILWTCRENIPSRQYLTEALDWCKQNNIPIDAANTSIDDATPYDGLIPRKIYADMYIDDKAFNPFGHFTVR